MAFSLRNSLLYKQDCKKVNGQQARRPHLCKMGTVLKTANEIELKEAQSPSDYAAGAHLFQAYVHTLQLDLSFQNFATELQTISQQYSRPTGALLLAYHQQQAVGCVALRALEPQTAELKRLFVLPAFQESGIGQRLLAEILHIAQALQYKCVRLDTLATMQPALKLYRRFDFYEIPPYRFNPIEGAIYMEKQLP